eukprot:228098-Prymnesium_polylepis.1
MAARCAQRRRRRRWRASCARRRRPARRGGGAWSTWSGSRLTSRATGTTIAGCGSRRASRRSRLTDRRARKESTWGRAGGPRGGARAWGAH